MAKSNSKNKNHLLLLLAVLLIAISVGYAAFSQSLFINGTATANGDFKLIFKSAELSSNIGTEGSGVSISADGATLSIDMQLEYPGAGGTVVATIENSGKISAKLKDVTITGEDDPDIYVKVKNAVEDEVLQPGETKNIEIDVKWNENSEVNTKSVKFTAELDYEQYTTNYNTNANATNTNG